MGTKDSSGEIVLTSQAGELWECSFCKSSHILKRVFQWCNYLWVINDSVSIFSPILLQITQINNLVRLFSLGWDLFLVCNCGFWSCEADVYLHLPQEKLNKSSRNGGTSLCRQWTEEELPQGGRGQSVGRSPSVRCLTATSFLPLWAVALSSKNVSKYFLLNFPFGCTYNKLISYLLSQELTKTNAIQK